MLNYQKAQQIIKKIVIIHQFFYIYCELCVLWSITVLKVMFIHDVLYPSSWAIFNLDMSLSSQTAKLNLLSLFDWMLSMATVVMHWWHICLIYPTFKHIHTKNSKIFPAIYASVSMSMCLLHALRVCQLSHTHSHLCKCEATKLHHQGNQLVAR